MNQRRCVRYKKLAKKNDKWQSWGFLGPATTWGNGRISQSFWGLENNSVGLKSLFCGIAWSEIQSYRKATCSNLVVLTFIKKLLPPGIEPGSVNQRADALSDDLSRLCWNVKFFLVIYIQNCKISHSAWCGPSEPWDNGRHFLFRVFVCI